MDALAIAQSLIQIGSDTANSNVEISAMLRDRLRSLGFEVLWHDYRDLRGCPKVTLSACRQPAQNSDSVPGLAFFSHSDVVSGEGWKTLHGSGPWEPIVIEERLWGRGACDMKGPMAAMLAALEAIDPGRQRGPLYVFITGDEECGMVGAEFLVKNCPLYRQVVSRSAMGVVTEPTQLRVVTRHKGGCRFRVSAHGIAAHSSTAEGLNANWQLIQWLSRLREMELLAKNDPRMRNEDFDPPTLSLNPVIRNQPCEFNITVSQAQCEVYLRIMPNTQWQSLVDELLTAARDLELEVSAMTVLPPLNTSAEHPLVQKSLGIVHQSTPDSAAYATDASRYWEIPNLIVLGPGSVAQAHRCDEWISLEQLDRGAVIYQKFMECFATDI